MRTVLDIVGTIVGVPFVLVAAILASVSELFCKVGCWFMNIEYEEYDEL